MSGRSVCGHRVVVAIRPIPNGERGSGLKRCDARNRPPTQRVFPPASAEPRNIPDVERAKPLAAMKIAQPAIESHPALGYGNRSQLVGAVLGAQEVRSFAGAVETPRPGIGRRQLKSSREAPFHTRLQGMVGRIALAGADPSLSQLPDRGARPFNCRGLRSARVVSLWLTEPT